MKRVLVCAVMVVMLLAVVVIPSFAYTSDWTEEDHVQDWCDAVSYERYPMYRATLSVGDYIVAPTMELESWEWFCLFEGTPYGVHTVADWVQGYVNVRPAVNDSGTGHIEFNMDDDVRKYHLFLENGKIVRIQIDELDMDEYGATTVSETYTADRMIYYSPDEKLVTCLRNMGARVEYQTDVSHGLIPTIFDGFGSAISGLAGGLKQSFASIVYVNGVGGEFSPVVIFIFTMAGLALATAILYKIFAMVRARKG